MSDEDVTIYVSSATPGSIFSKINGYFTVRGEKIMFRAIAFGRIGGHNVNVKIAKKNEKKLRNMGIDSEDLLIKVQRKMVLGDMNMPETKDQES